MTTRLNLRPWREMRRREQDRQLLSVAVGAWVLMGVIALFANLHVNGLIETQQRRNDLLTQEIAKLDEQIKEIATIKNRRAALIARMNVIQQLQTDRTRVVRLFDELVRKLPEGLYLSSFKHSGNNISLVGVAQSNARVSALMRNLAGSVWFADPELEVINVKARGSDRVSEFSIKVKSMTKPKSESKGEGAGA